MKDENEIQNCSPVNKEMLEGLQTQLAQAKAYQARDMNTAAAREALFVAERAVTMLQMLDHLTVMNNKIVVQD